MDIRLAIIVWFIAIPLPIFLAYVVDWLERKFGKW